ncbi:MAG TPA: hypothetical protein VEA16_08865 [Vicinamibacterales bacterium]|nr:hypothetical protein [Vicinamibacterales bacterium]
MRNIVAELAPAPEPPRRRSWQWSWFPVFADGSLGRARLSWTRERIDVSDPMRQMIFTMTRGSREPRMVGVLVFDPWWVEKPQSYLYHEGEWRPGCWITADIERDRLS